MRTGVLALLTGMLALAACSNSAMSSMGSGTGGGPAQGPPMFDVRGNWQITTQSQSGAAGGATANLQQNLATGSITGSLTNIEPACATSASLSGSVNTNHIQFSADENGQTASFAGTATATGGMSGTYTSSAGGCTNGDTGSWTASRTSGPS